MSCNVRMPFKNLVRRAGLVPWPRLFQNLRASCETDLAAEFPGHVVAAWIGHSQETMRKHYLQMRESDYLAATTWPVQKAVQARSEIRCGLARTRGD